MEGPDVAMLLAVQAEVCHPERGHLAEERPGVLRERVERRETVTDDHRCEECEVEREGAWVHGERADDPGRNCVIIYRECGEYGRGNEEDEAVEGEEVRFEAAKNLVCDLFHRSGCQLERGH